MVSQLAAMTRQLESLQSELRALRAENALLQQQVAAARGVQQHQPYAPLLSTCSLPRIEPPQFAYTPPRPTADDRQHLPTASHEMAASSPDQVEPKRARHSAAPAGAEAQDATMTDASTSALSSSSARRSLSLGPHEAHDF